MVRSHRTDVRSHSHKNTPRSAKEIRDIFFPELLTPLEAAEQCGLTLHQIYYYCDQGKLGFKRIKTHGRVLVDPDSLVRFLHIKEKVRLGEYITIRGMSQKMGIKLDDLEHWVQRSLIHRERIEWKKGYVYPFESFLQHIKEKPV